MSIAHEFQVLELIGRGSFGCVRKVRRKSDGKIYVRKEISYIAMNPKERNQISAEFKIMRELDHPNIVQYFDHDYVSDQHIVHIYMEYCDGGDLSTIIKRYREKNEFIPEDFIWTVFTQVLLALYRCHNGIEIENVQQIFSSTPDIEPITNNERVIIHRDIKPDNIFLISDNYTVKLGDFGLAKMLKHENEFAKTYVGTPYYMSPEVLMDRPYSPVCDVWSLGCVMYELCALKPPFQAKTHLSLQEKIKAGSFTPIPDFYSHRLQMVINACLIVDPDERATVNQLLQDASFKIFRKDWEIKRKEWELKLVMDKAERELNEQYASFDAQCEARIQGYRKEFEFVLNGEKVKAIRKFISELHGFPDPVKTQLLLLCEQQAKKQQQQQQQQQQQSASPPSPQKGTTGSNTSSTSMPSSGNSNSYSPVFSSPVKLKGPRDHLSSDSRRPLGLVSQKYPAYDQHRLTSPSPVSRSRVIGKRYER